MVGGDDSGGDQRRDQHNDGDDVEMEMEAGYAWQLGFNAAVIGLANRANDAGSPNSAISGEDPTQDGGRHDEDEEVVAAAAVEPLCVHQEDDARQPAERSREE